MKKVAVLVGLIVLMGVPALAQEYPKAEIFGGFSYGNVDTGILFIGRENFLGWQANLSGNFHKNVGFAADLGGQYKEYLGVLTVSTYEFLFGPRFTVRGDRATGFAHALFGGATIRGGGESETSFAMGFGGGVDVNIGDRIAIRVIQFDYLPTRFYEYWQHNIRLGFGVVFKVGGR